MAPRGGDHSRLRKIYSVVLPNELAKPGWKNSTGAETFAQIDLEKRVVRHVLRILQR